MSDAPHPAAAAEALDQSDERATLGLPSTSRVTSLTALAGEINELLAAARLRLIHLARLQGLTPDAADDVAQDVLLTAWRSLDRLRSPDRFDAWLDGITRNISRRYLRALRAASARIALPAHAEPGDGVDEVGVGDDSSDTQAGTAALPFAHTLDLSEELTSQDLSTLLNRALGHLSPGARAAVECYYLAE
jgi:RNA polymerase sigma factor (sigma-70 family)